MTEQAVKLQGICQTCGSPCDGWAVQNARDGRLRWDLTWNCRACGTVSDDGDWGPAPDPWREELLSQHGTYRLRLEEGESGGAKALKVFREVFGGSLKDAQESARILRQHGYDGTFVETELLRERLLQEGVRSVVARVGND